MKTAIVGGRLITPERIIDDGILCLEDGKISGIVRGEVPEGAKAVSYTHLDVYKRQQ